MPISQRCLHILPGLFLSLGVTLAAIALETFEIAFLGGRWLESLVLAIIIGAAIRSTVHVKPHFEAGITFSAKLLLEIAVVLLGASISLKAIEDAGAGLVVGIALTVIISIGLSFLVGRMLGLSSKLSTLVACGNSICGNSAIAAVAPVIDADADDVAASIAFTAVLGVLAVLLMPLLQGLLGLTSLQYGTFAGLTVYAVPQVLAATAPAGLISMQAGTLVKLIRVLMLGPVIFTLGLVHGARDTSISMRHMLPWFILGFAAMIALRSLGFIPEAALGPISAITNVLTIIAMAALGLSVDVRHTARAGGRVITAAIFSLLLLSVISILLIHMLQIA